MAQRSLAIKLGPTGDIMNAEFDGKPLAEASHADLVDLVLGLVGHANRIRDRLASPGLERRAWRDKPPEDRKPGAQLVDTGGVR